MALGVGRPDLRVINDMDGLAFLERQEGETARLRLVKVKGRGVWVEPGRRRKRTSACVHS